MILAFVPVFLLMINLLYLMDKSYFYKFSHLYSVLVYIAVPWSVLNFAVFNADGDFNGILLLCFFAIIWGTDVGAYMFGITLGQKYGKKLFPSISPKKSWIGFWKRTHVASWKTSVVRRMVPRAFVRSRRSFMKHPPNSMDPTALRMNG